MAAIACRRVVSCGVNRVIRVSKKKNLCDPVGEYYAALTSTPSRGIGVLQLRTCLAARSELQMQQLQATH